MQERGGYKKEPPGKLEFPAFLKESLAKNFVRQPFGLLGYLINWTLSLNFVAARRREGDVSPCGATYFARGQSRQNATGDASE